MSQLKTEGKSPHKKGTKKYNAHMAAMHAESTEEKRWKQTSMSPQEAIAKYGKENVKVKKGALRNGDDMVEVFVESLEVNPNAGHRDQMAHPENQMGTGPGLVWESNCRMAEQRFNKKH